MEKQLQSLAATSKLLPGEFLTHAQRNQAYMMELTTDNLLLHFRREAGLIAMLENVPTLHWGWDSPLSDLRGQVTGHWLSAAARWIHSTGDAFMKTKADYIVSEIGKCQQEHGNGWMFPIPEKNLYWLKRGKHSWAPQYVCHKCMLGLLEMYTFTGNQEAYEILLKAADWFSSFTADISTELMDDMMDWQQTGGMMELWADLYALSGEEKHLRLMRLYERRRLFEPLLRGEDVLTNMHANTTIPQIHGAARAYEVTGEERYRKIAETYWRMAVDERGMYATGGQTCGEIWTPPFSQRARLNDKNQEHCVVYNMIRLADYLFRWSGKKEYADYIERNLWNGLLSQAHWQEDRNNEIDCDIPRAEWKRGLVAYYQPLAAGSQKRWATKTASFWCCVDTMLQANTIFQDFSWYQDEHSLYLLQYHGVDCITTVNGNIVKLHVDTLPQTGENIKHTAIQRIQQNRPNSMAVEISIESTEKMEKELLVRIPWWCGEEITAERNGEPVEPKRKEGYLVFNGPFIKETICIRFSRRLSVWPLADEPDTVAFMDGPLVLAGLSEQEIELYGDIDHPQSILQPANERIWQVWMQNWKTVGQPVNISFKPLYKIGNEKYTVYYPVRKRGEREL